MQRLPIFKGRIIDLGVETVELPNGLSVELEIIRHPGAVAIVPVHADGTVTLIHQHRHGADGLIYEVPAGLLEEGEVPDLAARRELKEETGLKTKRLVRLGTIHTTPGFTDERIWIFLATELTQGPAAPEPDEVIEVVRMPLEQAIEMVDAGEITDAKTICALWKAQRHLARG
ncbi:MAG: NUDIX hydrolase [Alphaproteobacteria bacterium]|nr:NUDIX hydrolase [Alphaproteobacteria bacterium]